MSSDYRLHVTARPSLEVMKELKPRPLCSREDTVDCGLLPIEVEQLLREGSLPKPILEKVLKRRLEAFENAKRLKQQAYEKWEADAKRPLTEEEKELIERDRKEMILFTRVIIAAIIAVAICIAIAFFAA